MRNARLTACCGQHYCESCLTCWLREQKGKDRVCLHCRKPNFQTVFNWEKIREINEMLIHCTHHDKGCKWVGELSSIKQHLQMDKGCNFVEVQCNRYGYRKRESTVKLKTCWEGVKGKGHYNKVEWEEEMCGIIVQRQHLSNHQNNQCKFRQYSCEYCGYVDTYDAIAGTASIRNRDSLIEGSANHYSKCENFPLKCPNECGENLTRIQMNTHKKTCPLELIDCPLEANCRSNGIILHKVLRKDIEQHKKVCEYRPYTCEYCGCIGTFISITGLMSEHKIECHYDSCHHYPLECPNECGDVIKRKNITTHREICPLEPTDCPFKTIGCTVKVTRNNMDNHIQTNIQSHLLLMVESHQELVQKNKELVHINKELVHKQTVMARQYEASNRDLQKRIEKLEKRKK